MIDEDKVVLDVSAHENLQAALLGVFDSQICGGKRYDLAPGAAGARHLLCIAWHRRDHRPVVWHGPTPLIVDSAKDLCTYVQEYVQRLRRSVRSAAAALKRPQNTVFLDKIRTREHPDRGRWGVRVIGERPASRYNKDCDFVSWTVRSLN
jgi:hypothetical protein